jgi:uncharacterized protein (TIGR02271 family)
MATKPVEDSSLQTPQTETQTDNPAMVIPVIQEEITIDKRVIETGKVRISKRISEHEELVDVPIFQEQVSVERIPMNLFVEAQPQVRQEGDTLIIPVVQEQVVIQKKLLLVEELRVRKQIVESHHPQQVTLFKEEVDIKRSAVNENPDSQNVE